MQILIQSIFSFGKSRQLPPATGKVMMLLMETHATDQTIGICIRFEIVAVITTILGYNILYKISNYNLVYYSEPVK